MRHYSHARWGSPDLRQTSTPRPDLHSWWQQTPQMRQRWHDIPKGIRKTECQRNYIGFARCGCQLQAVQWHISPNVHDVGTSFCHHSLGHQQPKLMVFTWGQGK
jgi:hypothetical protein